MQGITQLDGNPRSREKKTRKFAQSIPEWIQNHPAYKSLKAGPRGMLAVIASRCDRPDAYGNLLGAWTGEDMREQTGYSNGAFWRNYKELENFGFITTLSRGGACGTQILGNTVGVPGQEGALDHLRVERRASANGKGGTRPSKFDKSSVQKVETGKHPFDTLTKGSPVSQNSTLPVLKVETGRPKNSTLPVLKVETTNPLQPCGNHKTTLSCSAANKLQPLTSFVGVVGEKTSACEEEDAYPSTEVTDNARKTLAGLGILEPGLSKLMRDHPKITSAAIQAVIKGAPANPTPGFYVNRINANIEMEIDKARLYEENRKLGRQMREKLQEHMSAAVARYTDATEFPSVKYTEDHARTVFEVAKRIGFTGPRDSFDTDGIDDRAVAVWYKALCVERNTADAKREAESKAKDLKENLAKEDEIQRIHDRVAQIPLGEWGEHVREYLVEFPMKEKMFNRGGYMFKSLVLAHIDSKMKITPAEEVAVAA